MKDGKIPNPMTIHPIAGYDKLIIGKFCQIAAGVEFVMNGANQSLK